MAKKPVNIQNVNWSVEITIAAFLTGIFVVMTGAALTYPEDARLFPLIIGTAGLFMSLIVLVQSVYWYSSARKMKAYAPAAEKLPGRTPAERRKWWISFLSAPIFGALLWIAGFYIASAVALTFMPYGLGYKRLGKIVLLMAATVLGMKLLFSDIMGIRMPHGLLGEWFLGTFVYKD